MSAAPHTVGKSFPCRTNSVHFRARSFALSSDIEQISQDSKKLRTLIWVRYLIQINDGALAYAIKNGAPLIRPSADGATPVKFVVYVGHDTNIANVAGLLGLQWPAGDYPANDVAPGAALAFEVRRSAPNESNEYVHPVMLAQPPDSLRGDGSEIRSVPLPISGCNGPNGSCAMSDFVKIVKNAIKHDENNACITNWRDLAD